ncbi:MAG TPA: type II secretion protein F [Rhodospirillaceae bacterium]|nr:type II secretion system F family protein [Alphaproteobacteria bacterium]HBH27100.1 type II secretion protein F [Rhodospirillaceae bacterium]
MTLLLGAVALVGFVLFALPFLSQGSKKERYLAIIEKRRAELASEAKRLAKKQEAETAQRLSGRESMSTLYHLRKLAGDMGEQVRLKMFMAGIRSPSAPLKFIAAQIILPVVLTLLAVLFISSGQFQFSQLTKLIILLVSAGVGYKLPDLMLQNQITKRQEEINLIFPDALDLMLICVQGGIGLEQAVERVAREIAESSEILAEEMGVLSAEMSLLGDRRLALKNFADRMGVGAAKTFATAILQAEQYGASISSALKIMAEELRDMRMAAAEEKAAGLPPKLTVPMILFFLPALFIIILGPAGIQISQQMGGQ